MCSGGPKTPAAAPPPPPPIPPAALLPQDDASSATSSRAKSRGRASLRMQDAQVGTSGGAAGLGIPGV